MVMKVILKNGEIHGDALEMPSFATGKLEEVYSLCGYKANPTDKGHIYELVGERNLDHYPLKYDILAFLIESKSEYVQVSHFYSLEMEEC